MSRMGFFEGEMQAVLTCTLPPTRSEKSKTNIKRAKSKDILEIIPCYPKMEEELANMEKDLEIYTQSIKNLLMKNEGRVFLNLQELR